MLRLDDNYSLDFDSYNVMLRYENKAVKEIKGELKEVTQKYQWYYPNVKQALKRYIQVSLNPVDSLEEIINRMDKLEKVIDNLETKILLEKSKEE